MAPQVGEQTDEVLAELSWAGPVARAHRRTTGLGSGGAPREL